MLTMYMIYNFDELSINSGNLIDNIGSMIQAQNFLNDLKAKEKQNPDGESSEAPADGSIEMQKVSVLVGDNLVLNELDLSIQAGDVVLLTGRNGSGKSTVLKTLFGGLAYTGSIKFGGQEVRDMKAEVLRANITYVPQVPHLFHRSVYENISYGNNATREEVAQLLYKFGVDFVGMDDIIGNSHLSGGQQQLIYLLRAYLQSNSKLILLDEPTSALDNRTRDKAMHLLSTLMAGRTAIIVTHDEDLVQYSTRVVKLGDV
jgi:ABC-type bacteriocin/lantibiotic exporter with double-glycine peptidase domain